MKLLYIGDVMAEPGIKAVETVLPGLISEFGVDVVIAQAENVSGGKGMNTADYERLKNAGVHIFTGGNHTPVDVEIHPLLLDPAVPVIGPANMPDCPGLGYKVVRVKEFSVLAISILGAIVGKDSERQTDNPLKTVDSILAGMSRLSYNAAVVNYHGDFSSEKMVFAHYLDGRASLVVGDHWHVPTADAEILPKGTARVTDVGMCGSLDSSLGVKYSAIIPRWRDGMKTPNELELTGRMQFNAVLAEVDSSGRALGIQQIRKVWSNS